MLQANTVLEAWDKTFETMDFSHLAQYPSEDFQEVRYEKSICRNCL